MAAQELAVEVGVAPACEALGVPRATFYRRQRPLPGHQQPRPTPARALCESERERVLDLLACLRFVDRSPAEVIATLLDEGEYLCSERTMYRVLAANQLVRERRNQREHPPYTKPELVATGPNQVWSWDVTKLLGPKKWTYFYLYVLLDVFSRFVVGWRIQHRESAEVAKDLIAQSIEQQGVQAGQLTVHADRGPSMRSKPVAFLLADLGVTKTHSRPYTSTDNPYSEAHFKTLKYQPAFPKRFGGFEDAHGHCTSFFPWYNHEHHHSALGWLTPGDVHYGRAQGLLERRAQVLAAAYAAHPERFPHGPPAAPKLPDAVWINPPKSTTNIALGPEDAQPNTLPATPIPTPSPTVVSLH